MKFKKLRVVWSVGWGVVAVLLVGFWVRSYWWTDFVYAHSGEVGNTPGAFLIAFESDPSRWPINHIASDVFLKEFSKKQKVHKSLGLWGAIVWNPGFFAIFIPYWFLMLLTTVLGVAPWLRKISWHFSLRTLLIATTILALALGTLVWLAH
jgi:hypothetical protein